jgi:hypothetical protein
LLAPPGKATELRRWDMRGGANLTSSLVVTLAFTADGKQLVSGNANSTLFVLDLP